MIVSDWFNRCLNLTAHMGEDNLEKIIGILENMNKKTRQIENTTRMILLVLLLPLFFGVFWFFAWAEMFF